MTNLAVYSVLVGPTGVGPAPVPPSNSYDLVLFTDDPDITAEHWDVRLIDTHGLDSARAAKRAKILAHRYLPDHDWSLFLDTGIALEADPVDMLERYAGSGPSFFSFRHRDRMCLYEEAEAVIERGEEDERRVREQADHYRRLGFPHRFGLIAGALLLRRHNDRAVMEVAEDWYEHLLRYSAREELAFAFAAWRHGFEPGHFDGDIADNACIAPSPDRRAGGRAAGSIRPPIAGCTAARRIARQGRTMATAPIRTCSPHPARKTGPCASAPTGIGATRVRSTTAPTAMPTSTSSF
ncbi:DUF616 domain-containing protein [Kaustia mangrovi]|uniref:DUF616 domain-containing protein n=1 Tax=Kaustia mangrovi TaxID=2593653 RepID=A0A7S8C2W5_9HYPH|nr:glycosyltransferase domain-containing protein [Kaustia mangrovi]QPC42322.1 DUF616 domain-containing protein [Kaustia mangrovi]